MAVICDRNSLLAVLALLMVVFVPSPALSQKKHDESGAQTLSELKALVGKAKALDVKVYLSEYDAALRQ
jgi:hypothetical protein